MRPILLGFIGFSLLAACAQGSPGTGDSTSPPRLDTFLLASRTFANERTIRVWLPPGYDDRRNRHARYPVLYLNDGFAVFSAKAWNAPDTLDRLVRAGEVEPLILIGIDNGATAHGGSPAQRTREYVPYEDLAADEDTAGTLGERYPDFLLREVIPAVERRYRVRRDAAGRGIGGSSYGGLAAVFTVIRRPGSFSRLLIESTPVFLAQFRVLEEATPVHEWPVRIHVGAGTAETNDPKISAEVVANTNLIASRIRSLAPSSRVEVVIEPGAGHTGKAWGGRLGPALHFLWPG